MYVSWSVFLSVFPLDASIAFQLYCHWLSVFNWLFISMFGYTVTDCTYIGTSLIPLFCLSLFPSVFLCPGYIIGNLHVCEQARSGRSVCNRALENVCIIILNSAYIPTSLHSYLCLSVSLWMSVPESGYIIIHCMCIYVAWSWLFFSMWPCFSVFSLNGFIGFRLYCHWLSVYRFVSWSAFLSMFLSVCLSDIHVYYR